MSVPDRKYVWDETKALANLRKHGVEFEEAREALEDPFALVVFDEEHSAHEDRFRLIGYSAKWRALMVVYTDAEDQTTRIVSARRATRLEQRIYEENLRQQG